MGVTKVFSKYTTKEGVKELGEAAQEFIKKGKTEKKAEELLTVPKKEFKVGDKTVTVADDAATGTVFKVDKAELAKKKIQVRKITPTKKIAAAGIDEADDVLFKYNAYKITPKVLDDFNISKFNNKEDIVKFIDLISKKYKGEIFTHKRGTQTTEQLKLLSTWLQKDPKQLQKTLLSLRPGQTLNAEYMYAARELLAAGMKKLDDMAQAVSSGKANDLQKLEFRQHMALMAEFQKIVKGVQTETARTFRQFQVQTRTKEFTHIDLEDLNKQDLLLELGGPDETKALATMFLKSGTNKAKNEFTQGTGALANLKKFSDSIAEIFINAILSNPMTHIRNGGGNWIAQAIIQMERAAVARLQGGKVPGGVAAYEDVMRAYGKTMAHQEMWQALSVALKGKPLKEILKNFDELIPATHGGTKIEMRSHRAAADNFNIENKFAAGTVDWTGRILTMGRIPTRMLTTADNFFKNREYRAELYALAFRETMENIQKGTLKEADAPMFLASRVLNPTSTMVKTAKEGMLYSVFQTKMQDRPDWLGKIGQIAQKTKGSTGYFSWLSNYYIPFTQTPINIAGFVAERTPVLANLLTSHNLALKSKDPAVRQLAKMKVRLGTMFYFAFSVPGYYGVTSGADVGIPGKTTGGKYEMMKGFNYQPNSIRFGGYQFNLTGLDPMTTLISQAANLGATTEAMLNHTGIGKAAKSLFDDKESGIAFSNVDINEELIAAYTFGWVLSFGENLTNSTFLKGAGDAVSDMQNLGKVFAGDMPKGKFGKKLTMDFSKAFIPSLLKQTSKLTVNDDFRKLSTEWKTLVQSTLYNKNLPDSYNMFGKKIDSFGFLSKYRHGLAENEVKSVMPKLSKKPTTIQREFNPLNGLTVSFPMTDREQEFFDYNAGLLFTKAIETELLPKKDYKNAERLIKEGYIQKALSASRSAAMAMLKADGKKEYITPGGAKTKFPKSKFYDSIEARALDLLKDKYLSHNRSDPLSVDTKEEFNQLYKQQNREVPFNQ